MVQDIEEFMRSKHVRREGLIKNLNESQMIEMAGGKENLRIINESGICDESYPINEFLDFLSSGGPTSLLGKRGVIELVAGMLSKLVEKSKFINKGSIIWYVLTYGFAHAVWEMGEDLIESEGDIDEIKFCEAFAVGASESVGYWLTEKVVSQFLKVLGFNNGSNKLQISVRAIQDLLMKDDRFFNEFFKSSFCGESIMEIDGKKYNLAETFLEIGLSPFKKAYSMF